MKVKSPAPVDLRDRMWPEPDLSVLGDGLPEAPVVPFGCLTARWSSFVDDSARGKSCPADYVVGGLFSSAAALLSGARCAMPWADWIEPAIIWVALVGDPSSGKSPALDTVLGPLREIEEERAAGFATDFRQHVEAVERARAVKNQWRESLHKATKGGGNIAEMPEEAMEPDEPQRPRLVTSDSTIEKIALILSGNKGRGLLSYRDELSGWLNNFERHGGSDRAFWVECFGGRPHTQDRVKHPKPIRVECLAVSIVGGIQPDRLRSFTMKNDDDGMAARFLFCYPAGSPPFERPKRLADVGFAASAFSKLAALEAEVTDEGRRKPRVVPFSEEAADILEQWRSHSFPAHESQAHGLLLSAVGKMPGLVVRLALIIEYLDWSAEIDRPEPEAISASAVDAAISFVEDYAIPMARRALAAGSQPVEAKNAALAARWVLDNLDILNMERENLRDLRRRPGFPIKDPTTMDRVEPLLTDAGFWRPLQSSNTRGTKRKDVEISPRLSAANFAKFVEMTSEPGHGLKLGKVGKLGSDEMDEERTAIQVIDGDPENDPSTAEGRNPT